MSSPLSSDLRTRVSNAVEEGSSRRQSAVRFEVSASSAIRRRKSFDEEGRVEAKPLGGDRRSHHVEAHAALILSLYESGRRSSCRNCGPHWPSAVSRRARAACVGASSATASHAKNTAHAAEQDRADVKVEREDWFEGQLELDPDSLVFIDETAATTAMERRYGRAPRGERCRVAVPQGHWKTTTVTAALRTSGLVATVLFDEATNGDRFLAYVTESLIPALKPGDTVILDNLSGHKVAGVRGAIQTAGAKLLYLPPYSPDFNPIEQVFAKLKALLRSAATRTITELREAIGRAFAAFTPDECRNYRAAAGYDADDPI